MVLTTFDLAERIVSVLIKPENVPEDSNLSQICVLDDCLSILATIKRGAESHIWVMKIYNDGDSWIDLVVKHSLTLVTDLIVREDRWSVITSDDGWITRMTVYPNGKVVYKDLEIEGRRNFFELGPLVEETLISPYQ